jgi:uncharacterized protein (DUF488 family)
MTNEIFTIGHSNHTTEQFLALLRAHGVNAVADVRSSPRTRVNPDFCSPQIEKVLASAGISYVFLGEELGARSSDESCYEGGKVVYSRLARQHIFQQALDRIEMGSEKFLIALLCAEKEPLECHRCILVARHLVARDLKVSHILADGLKEEHAATIARLKQTFRLAQQQDMFMGEAELTDMAYGLQEEKIAYEIPEPQMPDVVV